MAEQGRADCRLCRQGYPGTQPGLLTHSQSLAVGARPTSPSLLPPKALGGCRHTHLLQDGGGPGPDGQPWGGRSRRLLLRVRVLQQPASARLLHQGPVGSPSPNRSERGSEGPPDSQQSSLATQGGTVKCRPLASACLGWNSGWELPTRPSPRWTLRPGPPSAWCSEGAPRGLRSPCAPFAARPPGNAEANPGPRSDSGRGRRR